MALPGCKCEKTAKFLESIGAKHTARMHARDAANKSGHWTVEDWLIHMREEENHLNPILREWGMGVAADVIEREHRVLRTQLRGNGTMDATLLTRHSRFEDEIIEELQRRMASRHR